MSTYSQTHTDLFRAVADILVRDYIAPSETADTVETFCLHIDNRAGPAELMEPSELAALIADVEGYERRE